MSIFRARQVWYDRLAMSRSAWQLAFLMAFAATAMAADERDPLVLARQLYNQRDFQAAIALADRARLNPAGTDSADLIAARAFLERFRESAAAGDLTSARERLRRVDPQRFGPRERVEYIVGLGETLYLEGSYGAAADVFDSVLALAGALTGGERERVVEWWASALDRDARPRTDFERQAVYQRIRDRMHAELGTAPTSAAAVYWLSAAARGQGDLQGAWDAAEAGWVRAPLAGDRGVALRADLEQLVMRGLVPERARALGQPAETIRLDLERFKERWQQP
jgi:hypothetical protein